MINERRTNNRFIISPLEPVSYERIRQTQSAFMQHLSGVLASYFEDSSQNDPSGGPLSWYKSALGMAINEYFKGDEQMIQEYSAGVVQVDSLLISEIFYNLQFSEHPSCTHGDLQRWEDNFAEFSRADKFTLRTGEMRQDIDGREKEVIRVCPASAIARYMVNQGYSLITRYLKEIPEAATSEPSPK